MWSRAIGLAILQRVAIIGLHRIPAVRAVGTDDLGFDAAARSLFNPRTDVEAQTGATNLFSSDTGHSGLQPRDPWIGCTTSPPNRKHKRWARNWSRAEGVAR
jgi:hypothetical protein